MRSLMRLQHYSIHTERKVISLMEGVPQLIVQMLYGSGLRVLEAVRLRVKDLDFAMKQVTVRSGKGEKDRMTTLSASLIPLLENHLRMVKTMQDRDLAEGHGAVYLPYALDGRRAMLGLATGGSRIRFRSVHCRHHA